MPNASGVFKSSRYKLESTYGTAAGQASGKELRRVTTGVALAKDTYGSSEIRSDLQMADFRHGVRRVAGPINGELSPGTWADFMSIILKRDFAAITAATSVSLTIAGTGPTYTVTRSAGDWLAGGFKKGLIVRLSVGGLNANNINKNLYIVDLTTTVMTVIVLNATALTAEGPIAGCTITVIGKTTFVPTTGHTNKSFSFEDWYSDAVQSELYLGCKLAQCNIALPPTGIATIGWDVRGQDFADTAAKRTSVALTSQYFTSPTAANTFGTLAAVNGIVRVGGATIAILTGLSIAINANFTGDPVVGSNVIPEQFPGRVTVSGQASMYFPDATMRDAFVNETEVEIMCVFSSDNSATSDFIAIAMPRCKLGGSTKDDGEKGVVQTLPFQALLNSAGGTGVNTERTTLMIQDSQAP